MSEAKCSFGSPCYIQHGSHRDWKSGKTWKNGKAFSSQVKVGEFCQDWKSRGILLKILENWKKLYWKIEKNTGKVGEICQLVIVKTRQIWYHTLNKKKNFKKYWKRQGKVGEICQSEKVGTMDTVLVYRVLYHIF